MGQVEFSEKGQEDSHCATALAASMNAFAVSEVGEGWSRLVRARLLIPRTNAEDARTAGAFHLAETLQTFNVHLSMAMGEVRPTDAGYLFDLRARSVTPLMPPWKRRERTGIVIMNDEVALHPQHVLNTLFVAPKAFGELGAAFRRSAHWRVLAGRTEDEGEMLLLYWMAAECLCKEVADEEISAKLLAGCGFPVGKIARGLDAGLARNVSAIPRHRSWRRQLTALFDVLRKARNSIVHAGYRHVDLPVLLRDEQRKLGLHVLRLVTKCLAEMALQALNHNHTTLAAMWRNYERALEPVGLVRHASWFIERLEDEPRWPTGIAW